MENEISITVIDRTEKEHQYIIPSDTGLNLMELCKADQLPVEGTCGGLALCGSCHVFVLSDFELPPPSYDEELMLDQLPGIKSNSRLACQIKLYPEVHTLKVMLAPIV
ncbi:MAG: 2Fe-2S iron-sulfur cluster binding domain-containing protein [Saprospiraceae bacterium]|nr:2Fe-2S iron-sulfur cluster binding domain-containing protein [Saprospiraceae bacterium]